MAYRFERGDKTVERGLRRIACEQIDRALASLELTGDLASAVHDVRKRCKKLRGLVRIVRTGFDGYEAEDRSFRDTARRLGGLRDQEVLLATFERLVDALGEQREGSSYAQIQVELSRACKDASAGSLRQECFGEARERLSEARRRATLWKLEADDWGVVCDGFVKTYTRARKAMKHAALEPTGEHHHEWRKHAQYHWLHTRLLRRLWPDRMAGRVDRAGRLSTLLGEHHDLFVFEQRIVETLASLGFAEEGEPLVVAARERRAALEEKAHRLGARLLARRPRKWNARCASWRPVA